MPGIYRYGWAELRCCLGMKVDSDLDGVAEATPLPKGGMQRSLSAGCEDVLPLLITGPSPKKRLCAQQSAFFVDVFAQVLPDRIGHGEEDVHNVGIELATGPLLDLIAGSVP